MFDFLFGSKKETPPVPPQANEAKNNEKSINNNEQPKSGGSQQKFLQNNPQTIQQVQMINGKKGQNAESSKGLREDKLDDDGPAATNDKKNYLGDQQKQTPKNTQSHTSPNPNQPNQIDPQPNGESPNVPNRDDLLPTTVPQNPGNQTNTVSVGNQNEVNQANPIPLNTISPTSDILELNNRLKRYKDNLYGPDSKQNKIKKLDLCFEVTSSQNYKRNLETLQKLKDLHDQRQKKQKKIETRKKQNAQKKKEWEEYLKQKKDYDQKIKQIQRKKNQGNGQLQVNQGQVTYKTKDGYQINVNGEGVGIGKGGVQVRIDEGGPTLQTLLQPPKPIGEMPGICSDCDWQQCCMNCGDFCQAICDGCDGIGEIMGCCSDCDCCICDIFDSCGLGWLPLLVVGILFAAFPLVYFGCVASRYCNSKETKKNLVSVTEQMLEIYNSYQGFAP